MQDALVPIATVALHRRNRRRRRYKVSTSTSLTCSLTLAHQQYPVSTVAIETNLVSQHHNTLWKSNWFIPTSTVLAIFGIGYLLKNFLTKHLKTRKDAYVEKGRKLLRIESTSHKIGFHYQVFSTMLLRCNDLLVEVFTYGNASSWRYLWR